MSNWKNIFRCACIAVLVIAVGCKTDPETAKRRYLESGQRYFEKQQYPEASIQFRKALQIDPRFAEAYGRLGASELKQRRWQEAFKAYSQQALLEPNNIDPHVQMYGLLMSGHQYLEAEQEAAAILRIDPKSAIGYELAGGAAFSRQLYKDALTDFEKSRDLAGGTAASHLNVSSAQIALGDYAGAEQSIKSALAKDPSSTLAYLNLANLYQVQAKPRQAVQTLQDGIQKNPDAEDLYTGLARILFITGDAAGAEQTIAQLKNRRGNSPTAWLTIAELYTAQSHPEKALESYQHGLSLDPKNDSLRLGVINGLLAQGKTNEAAGLIDQALKQDPKNPAWRVAHARVQMSVPATAENGFAELKKTVIDSPDYSDAHYYLGMAYLNRRDGQNGMSELEEAIRSDSQAVEALHLAAEQYAARGVWDIASDYAQRCVRLRPADARQRSLLGSILLRHNDPKNGLQQLHIATLLAPNSAEAHIAMAQGFNSIRDYKKAEESLAAAAKAEPDSVLVVGAAADYWISRGQAEKASSLAQAFAQSHPNDAQAQMILGNTMLESKHYAEAEVALNKALQLQPNKIEALALLAHVYDSKGQTQAAIDAYNKAIQLEPKSAPLYAAAGSIYLNHQDLAKAREYFKKSLDQDPNFPIAAANMAWINAQLNTDLDVALGLAQKAKQALPDSASITDTLAWVYIRKGNFAGAIPLLQECLKKNPENPVYHYHMAVALLGRGDKARAKAEFDTALRLKLSGQELEDARKLVAELK